MAEYINRDALFKYYRALANIEWNKTVAPVSWSDAYEEIADHIAELPTADVVPKREVERIFGEIDKIIEKSSHPHFIILGITKLKQKYKEDVENGTRQRY